MKSLQILFALQQWISENCDLSAGDPDVEAWVAYAVDTLKIDADTAHQEFYRLMHSLDEPKIKESAK